MKINVEIKEDSIEIGQLIKKLGLVSTGGQVKYFMSNNKVLINNKIPTGRSTKVHPDDIIWINDDLIKINEVK
ncbi:RNA-binding S4 domain-containing protein [Mycoplasmopsis adleri]|uniref:RNA-binding S4 domain-containing protein n=1 Tax=Mycoplasmopsis adleri TaxID=51362 RepID=UPI0038731AEF